MTVQAEQAVVVLVIVDGLNVTVELPLALTLADTLALRAGKMVADPVATLVEVPLSAAAVAVPGPKDRVALVVVVELESASAIGLGLTPAGSVGTTVAGVVAVVESVTSDVIAFCTFTPAAAACETSLAGI